MKRRTLLKGLSVVASGKLCSTPAWAMFGMDEVPDANAPLAVAIRGLRRKDGKLFQPIQIAEMLFRRSERVQRGEARGLPTFLDR